MQKPGDHAHSRTERRGTLEKRHFCVSFKCLLNSDLRYYSMRMSMVVSKVVECKIALVKRFKTSSHPF